MFHMTRIFPSASVKHNQMICSLKVSRVTAFFVALLATEVGLSAAEYLKLEVVMSNSPPDGIVESESIRVPPGDEVEVYKLNAPASGCMAGIAYSVGGYSNEWAIDGGPSNVEGKIIEGPASVRLRVQNTTASNVNATSVVILKHRTSRHALATSSAVVINADEEGDVKVLLELDDEWTPSVDAPWGSYDTFTTDGFSRVREFP